MAADGTNDPIEIGDPDPGNPGGGGGTSPGTRLFQYTFGKQVADSLVKVDVFANLSSPDDLQLVAYCSFDGIVRQFVPVNLIFDNQQSRAQNPITLKFVIDGVAIGNHEVAVSIVNREPDGPLTVLRGAYMEILEIKPAAL